MQFMNFDGLSFMREKRKLEINHYFSEVHISLETKNNWV